MTESKDTSMRLTFEGNTHSIDANTLIGVLYHCQTVVRVANETLGKGAREVRMRVNAVEKGSFVIDLSIVQGVLGFLFSRDTISYIADLICVCGGVYAFYEHFKGKPVRTEGELDEARGLVSSNLDETVSAYNQPVVREAISKSVVRADEDASVDGFSVSCGSKGGAEFTRARFREYIYDDFDEEKDIPDERTVEEEATLTIVSLSFVSGSRWRFVYNGFKIDSTVKDDALMRKIDEGERFGKGDAIRVRLRTLQRYNREYHTYENISYKIAEFLGHIVAPQTGELFDAEGRPGRTGAKR